jgi:hypothetical protein
MAQPRRLRRPRQADYFVVAAKSALSHEGREANVRQVGRELGVRYVIEGSVQTQGSRTRVHAQIVDAKTGAHLWAERFDKTASDMLDAQEEISARLARALDMQLIAAEDRRLQHERPSNLSSVEFTLRGWAIFFKTLSARGMVAALGMFADSDEAARL